MPQRAKSQAKSQWQRVVRKERPVADFGFNEERKAKREATGHKAQDSRRQQYAPWCLWKTLLDSRKLPACSLWLQPRLVGFRPFCLDFYSFRLIQSLPWLVKRVRNITSWLCSYDSYDLSTGDEVAFWKSKLFPGSRPWFGPTNPRNLPPRSPLSVPPERTKTFPGKRRSPNSPPPKPPPEQHQVDHLSSATGSLDICWNGMLPGGAFLGFVHATMRPTSMKPNN